MKASNLEDIEFKNMVIRLLKELSENFNKDAANKKGHRNHKKELIRNEYIRRNKCRWDEAEIRISDF